MTYKGISLLFLSKYSTNNPCLCRPKWTLFTENVILTSHNGGDAKGPFVFQIKLS